MSGGISWLDGKSWWEVSRDERSFCAELLFLARQDLPAFVQYLNDQHAAEMDPNANWELAYEAVFYRDVWHARGAEGMPFSYKRTFDLALFSDEDILIIEAKAQQGFKRDQLEEFKQDGEQVRLQVPNCRVRLAALASSKYKATEEVQAYFDGPYLTWAELAALYGDDPKLLRADELYEGASSNRGRTGSRTGHATGAELVAANEAGESFFVGRNGGLDGAYMARDLASGGWRTQSYQVDRDATQPANANWFSLENFVRRVAASDRG